MLLTKGADCRLAPRYARILMTSPPLRSQTVSVVVLGSFNPRIFEPLWLAGQGLVPEDEANAAERELIDKEFARIVFPWANVVVVGDRLQVESTGEIVSHSQVRDLVVGILRVLPHTPVTVVSIQHGAHAELASEEQWHKVGHTLAPKEIWQDILDRPGILDFAMQGVRPDDLTGSIRVRIQPSGLVHPGLFINVNDEFFMNDQRESEPARHGADLLEQTWPEAESRVDRIRGSLFERLID
jgi:hypothetical protein